MMSMQTSVPPLGGESEAVACGDRNMNNGINGNGNASSSGASGAWLSGLMNSAKNRDTLLRLESGLVTFMLDTAKSRLQLPPCNSFQRRIYVEVAVRFGLEHTLDRNPTSSNSNSSDPNAVLLVLVKSAKSAIPAVMLSQQIADKPKLVKRPKASRSNAAEASLGSGSAGGRPNSIKNVSQEEYEQARARIFKDARNRTEQNGSDNMTSGNSSSSDALDSLLNVRVVGGGIARGPEEGKSFARRRARMDANASTPDPASSAANGGGIASTAIVNPTTSSVAGGIVGENGNVATGNVNANVNGNLCNINSNSDVARTSMGMGRSMSMGDVGMGNVNANGSVGDRDDPDFDRCYDKWAVRGNRAAAAHQMMYPPQYQHTQHTYHNHVHGHRTMSAMPPAMSTMSHARAHAQAAAAAVSAYPIVPMYHVPRPPPPPPPRPLHFFPAYEGNQHHAMAPQHIASGMGSFSNHGMPTKQGNVNDAAKRTGMPRTPTYGLDSAADFPPLGAAPTSSASRNSDNLNRKNLQNPQRR